MTVTSEVSNILRGGHRAGVAMTESMGGHAERNTELENIERLAREEYAHSTMGKAYGLVGRWALYNYATEQMDYYGTAFELLQSNKDDNLLDIGCSDGVNLVRKRILSSHTGNLVGVDIDPAIFEFSRFLNSEMNATIFKPINFVSGKAESLPFKSNSFDGATAMYVLYHVPEPNRALGELVRVLKPHTRFVMATTGPDNKKRHRDFEAQIASELGIARPPIFTQSFDIPKANVILPEFFRIVQTVPQSCALRISPPRTDGGASLKAYKASLESMRKHFRPVPSVGKWLRVIRKVVDPAINSAFEQFGYFDDVIDRALFVCENNK